jgi:AraC-like DNA-binding protein
VEFATAHDTLLAAATAVFRELLNCDWVPTEVHFPHAQPRNTKPYLENFQCRLRFDSDQAMVVFPSRDLKRRVSGADPARLRTLEALTGAAQDTGLLPHLYRSLRVLLLQGGTTAASLAQSLAMHERTLARRLRAHGTSFRAVLDDVRYEAARQLLAESNLSVSRIATSLGYADGATFCKAFQRWSGRSPREWRVHAKRARET